VTAIKPFLEVARRKPSITPLNGSLLRLVNTWVAPKVMPDLCADVAKRQGGLFEKVARKDAIRHFLKMGNFDIDLSRTTDQ
jgi:hypothetical protein